MNVYLLSLLLLAGAWNTFSSRAGESASEPQASSEAALAKSGRKSLLELNQEVRELYGTPVEAEGMKAAAATQVGPGFGVALFTGGMALALACFTVVRILRVPPAVRKAILLNAPVSSPPDPLAEREVEAESVSAFVATFHAPPRREKLPEVELAVVNPVVLRLKEAQPAEETSLQSQFQVMVSRLLAQARNTMQQYGMNSEETVRMSLLTELAKEFAEMKALAGDPERLPVWQLACGLECLAKQLAGQRERVTVSTLRTLSAGLECLEQLAQPGIPADLFTTPPIRLLTVDDDPIGRMAIAFALKRSLGPPDQAEESGAALALTAKQAYDVIFLDVQMPGMDGFELCSKIHETELNSATPVVFVTILNDFQARAKSTEAGGNELIAKPFLTFEITVKALTLALNRRLRNRKGAVAKSAAGTPRKETVVSGSPELRANVRGELLPCIGPSTPAPVPGHARTVLQPGVALSEMERKDLPIEPSAGVPPRIERARELAQAVLLADYGEVCQRTLLELQAQLEGLRSEATLAAVPTAGHLNNALAGLLHKILEQDRRITPATLQTVATAVDLLRDLCAAGIKTDLIAEPPVRLLVVDDDPICCRAMTNALQLAFKKPDCASDGETALAMAGREEYDVIFLDIEMPGLDGYAVCSKLRELPGKSQVPVVFVTSHTDMAARTRSALSGGSEFITKPFLAAEVIVKAHTFTLRRRLRRHKVSESYAPGAEAAGLYPDHAPGERDGRKKERGPKAALARK